MYEISHIFHLKVNAQYILYLEMMSPETNMYVHMGLPWVRIDWLERVYQEVVCLIGGFAKTARISHYMWEALHRLLDLFHDLVVPLGEAPMYLRDLCYPVFVLAVAILYVLWPMVI